MSIEKSDGYTDKKDSSINVLSEKTTQDPLDKEREGLLKEIKESQDTMPRKKQEVVFDIPSDLVKDGSELGRFVRDILIKMRVLPREDYISMIPVVEFEVENLKKDASSVAKKHADRLIKRLRIENIINGKIEKGSDLNGAEEKYKNAEYMFDNAKKDLKESLQTLEFLSDDLPRKYKKYIDKITNRKDIMDEDIIFRVDNLITIGVLNGDIDADKRFLFNEFMVRNQEAINMFKEAIKNQMKALDEWNEAA